MRIHHTSLCVALLGSAVALAALSPAAAANAPREDWKRAAAATGHRSPASRVNAIFSAGVKRPLTFNLLYTFAGGTGDGSDSTAEVTFDGIGNMFGVSEYAGANGYGTLFERDTEGDMGLVHSFGATGDGQVPDGAPFIAANGNMYGTTIEGGSSGNGTIWELAADGEYSVLYNFASDEGSFMRGKLTEDKKGNLYGTALFGGPNGYGSVFRFNPAKGKLTILHAFNNSDGEYPEHGVIRDKAGNLYGVTAFGGTAGEGTVYEIAADGTFSTLHNFTNGADGGFLYGGLAMDKSGNLYGSTGSGGTYGDGTVFKLASGGVLTTLYNFTGGSDGAEPVGDTLMAGTKLFGTTESGGDQSCDCGGVYEITGKGKEKTVLTFTSATGGGYAAGLTPYNGAYYGTTSSYGSDGDGTLYSLTK